MSRAIRRFIDAQCAPVELFSFREAAPRLVQCSQGGKAGCYGRIRSDALLMDGQRALLQTLGGVEVALQSVEFRQIAKFDGDFRVLGAQPLLSCGERVDIETFGLR